MAKSEINRGKERKKGLGQKRKKVKIPTSLPEKEIRRSDDDELKKKKKLKTFINKKYRFCIRSFRYLSTIQGMDQISSGKSSIGCRRI